MGSLLTILRLSSKLTTFLLSFLGPPIASAVSKPTTPRTDAVLFYYQSVAKRIMAQSRQYSILFLYYTSYFGSCVLVVCRCSSFIFNTVFIALHTLIKSRVYSYLPNFFSMVYFLTEIFSLSEATHLIVVLCISPLIKKAFKLPYKVRCQMKASIFD